LTSNKNVITNGFRQNVNISGSGSGLVNISSMDISLLTTISNVLRSALIYDSHLLTTLNLEMLNLVECVLQQFCPRGDRLFVNTSNHQLQQKQQPQHQFHNQSSPRSPQQPSIFNSSSLISTLEKVSSHFSLSLSLSQISISFVVHLFSM
jgi:hypothetical protein